MEKDFDFERIGKRMPYQVPAGFFREMEAQVWKEIRQEPLLQTEQSRLRGRWRPWVAMMAVAASIALLLTLHQLLLQQSQEGNDPAAQLEGWMQTQPAAEGIQTDAPADWTQVEEAFAELSQEDQRYLLELYQADLFIDKEY